MKGGEKPMLDTKEVAEEWPEFQSEDKVFISDNWVRETMVTNYHVFYDICKPEGINDNLN